MTADDQTIQVVLADDHTLFRQGVKELLGTGGFITIVGEGSDGNEVLPLVEKHRPDVVLLDVEMPGLGVRSVIRQLRERYPDVGIIVLTMHHSPLIVRELLEIGAAAYLVKNIAREELIATVRSVNRSSENVTLSVSRSTMQQLDRQRNTETSLSARELAVLRLVAQALSNAQVGDRLLISEGTVKRHLTNIYGKLNAVSRVDAINRATEAGLLNDMGDG